MEAKKIIEFKCVKNYIVKFSSSITINIKHLHTREKTHFYQKIYYLVLSLAIKVV